MAAVRKYDPLKQCNMGPTALGIGPLEAGGREGAIFGCGSTKQPRTRRPTTERQPKSARAIQDVRSEEGKGAGKEGFSPRKPRASVAIPLKFLVPWQLSCLCGHKRCDEVRKLRVGVLHPSRVELGLVCDRAVDRVVWFQVYCICDEHHSARQSVPYLNHPGNFAVDSQVRTHDAKRGPSKRGGVIRMHCLTFGIHLERCVAKSMQKRPRMPPIVGRRAVQERAAHLETERRVIKTAVTHDSHWIGREVFLQRPELVNHSIRVPKHVHVEAILGGVATSSTLRVGENHRGRF
jgi:hypothetical protein